LLKINHWAFAMCFHLKGLRELAVILRSAAVLMYLLPSLGCDYQTTAQSKWTKHVLTSAEDERQEELLKNLFPVLNGSRDCLDGTSVDPYNELLSLADKTGVRDGEKYFGFNVPCAGEGPDESELIFIVSGQKIKWARWPFAEY